MLLRTRLLPPGFVEPCLPSPAERPPSGPGWLHEIKLDGFRLMARRDAAGVARSSPPAERAEARPAKATYRQSCCRTFGDGHLAREGAVEHPLHAVPEGGVASTGGGPMKTPKAMGSEKPGIVAVTVLLAVAITDTVPTTV